MRTTENERWRKFGRRGLSYTVLAALFLSLLIGGGFSEQEIARNAFFDTFSGMAGAIVPSIHRLSSVSARPATFAMLSSLNWVFAPFYFAFFCTAGPFWSENAVNGALLQLRKQKNFSLRKTLFWCALFVLCLVLSDLDVIRGPGVFSMGMYPTLPKTWMFRAIDGSAISIAMFTWLACLWEAAMYYGIVFVCGRIVYTKVLLKQDAM